MALLANQPQALINSYQLKILTGIPATNIKYHRLAGNIKSYQVAGQRRQYFYKLTDINRLMNEHTEICSGQYPPCFDIVNITTKSEGVKN